MSAGLAVSSNVPDPVCQFNIEEPGPGCRNMPPTPTALDMCPQPRRSSTKMCSVNEAPLVEELSTTGCQKTVRITWTASTNSWCSGATGTQTYSSTATQTYTYTDDQTQPVWDAPRFEELTVECNADVPPEPKKTLTDNCDGQIEGYLHSEGDRVPPVGSCTNRVYRRTWMAKDSCGNHGGTGTQTITVKDTTPPVVTPVGELACLWPPNKSYVCFKTEDFQSQIDVADNCGGKGMTWKLAGCQSDQKGKKDDCVVDPAGAWLCARSEQKGSGSGRRYSVAIAAVDACGNAAAPAVAGTISVTTSKASCIDASSKGCDTKKGVGLPCFR